MNALAKEKQRRDIIMDVLHRHGVTMDELMSCSRRVKYVDARVEIAARLYDIGFPLRRIGYLLDRDHSTVAHWLNHRRGGRLPQVIYPVPVEVRRYIEDRAAEKRTTPTRVIVEWITERALTELKQARSAA
jgi:hypothetical protein